jgi:hypothetical protein
MTARTNRNIDMNATAQAATMALDRGFVRILATVALVAALVLFAGQARATTFGFQAVEGLFPTDAISLDVSQSAGDLATFTLRNSGTDSGSITAIYFDWGSLSSLFTNPASIDDSLAGVDYTDDSGNWFAATPSNMPGASTLSNPFYADFGISPDKKGGVSGNGVGGGEYVSISWALGGADYASLLAALGSGDVRVGLHVQSLSDGSSATGVSTSATPIPGAVWLLGSGLLGLVGLRSRIRR